MARPRKVSLDTPKGREKIFLEIIDHLMRYNHAEKQWIADEAGISFQTLYNWCAGTTFSPQLRTIAAVARALGYEVVIKRTKAAPPKLKVIKGKAKAKKRKAKARATKLKVIKRRR
jgi:hypothetical protein